MRNKLRCYLMGFIMGMCIEYLYRVERSIYPAIMVIVISIYIFIDLMRGNDNQ